MRNFTSQLLRAKPRTAQHVDELAGSGWMFFFCKRVRHKSSGAHVHPEHGYITKFYGRHRRRSPIAIGHNRGPLPKTVFHKKIQNSLS